MNSIHVLQVRKLYKAILKLNRALPPSLMGLGNAYVKEEFKRHKNCNETQAKIFLAEWTCYAIDLSNQLGVKGIKKGLTSIGSSLTEEQLNKFKDDQILQLHELLTTLKSKDVG
ncbi:hypothetical protein WA026_015798 [Henosepilachna vigintioctopunctata]|uniref:Succinate dehydrogenase assembly factor 3 n=1 Tax=Henosepilachna vigintioctopunctata TaxID=420089 RepID=A0AAW1US30_9CUCU